MFTEYVDEITAMVVETATVLRLTGDRPVIALPPPLTAAYPKPVKEDVVKAHQHRFAEPQPSTSQLCD
jgi:hypothetical protein